jgi:hypothetical protein
MLTDWKAGRAAALAEIVKGVAEQLADGRDVAEAEAILRGLSAAEVYRELVDGAGWSAEQYETWLAGVLKRELLGPSR